MQLVNDKVFPSEYLDWIITVLKLLVNCQNITLLPKYTVKKTKNCNVMM